MLAGFSTGFLVFHGETRLIAASARRPRSADSPTFKFASYVDRAAVLLFNVHTFALGRKAQIPRRATYSLSTLEITPYHVQSHQVWPSPRLSASHGTLRFSYVRLQTVDLVTRRNPGFHLPVEPLGTRGGALSFFCITSTITLLPSTTTLLLLT
ncbi:hypothetical protein BC835DRAFT_877464 [Cytidiella melzeri]|nr:hypothetical protein BC835DRAFT_877464 [Cytidiella melzeri]